MPSSSTRRNKRRSDTAARQNVFSGGFSALPAICSGTHSQGSDKSHLYPRAASCAAGGCS